VLEAGALEALLAVLAQPQTSLALQHKDCLTTIRYLADTDKHRKIILAQPTFLCLLKLVAARSRRGPALVSSLDMTGGSDHLGRTVTKYDATKRDAVFTMEHLLNFDATGVDLPPAMLTMLETSEANTLLVSLLRHHNDRTMLATALNTVQLLLRLTRLRDSLVHGGLNVLIEHARRWLRAVVENAAPEISPTPFVGETSVKLSTLMVAVVRLTLSLTAGRVGLKHLLRQNRASIFFVLCTSPHKHIRRAATQQVQRLSRLEGSKTLLHQAGLTPLLIGLITSDSIGDPHVVTVATRALAELAEAPENRTSMLEQGVLAALCSLVEDGSPKIRFEVARALADLAEAVDNRLPMAIHGGDSLRQLIHSSANFVDDVRTRGHALRCVANLCSHAGYMLGLGPDSTTRFGSWNHVEYGSDSDSDPGDSGDDKESTAGSVALDSDDSASEVDIACKEYFPQRKSTVQTDTTTATEDFGSTQAPDPRAHDHIGGAIRLTGERVVEASDYGTLVKTDTTEDQANTMSAPRPCNTELSTSNETGSDLATTDPGEVGYWDSADAKGFAALFNGFCLDRIHGAVVKYGILQPVLRLATTPPTAPANAKTSNETDVQSAAQSMSHEACQHTLHHLLKMQRHHSASAGSAKSVSAAAQHQQRSDTVRNLTQIIMARLTLCNVRAT
jgi:hypothetical protein